MRWPYALGTSLIFAAALFVAAVTGFEMSCSTSLSNALGFVLFALLIGGWVAVLVGAVVGAIAGYLGRRISLALAIALLVVSFASLGVREFVAHVAASNTTSQCKIDL